MSSDPGWYFAEGDPPGTHRYWDGSRWVGDPMPVAPPPPDSEARPLSPPAASVPGPITEGSPVDYIAMAWKRTFDYSSRSRRAEFWWFQLAVLLMMVVLGQAASVVGDTTASVILGAFYLAIALPSLSLSIRRLHDVDRSGWWLLIAGIPILGLALLVFLATDSDRSSNRWGTSPKYG